MADLPFQPVLNFSRAVALKLKYTAQIPAQYLPRLGDMCLEILTPAQTSFEFFHDLQGLMTISGSISCEVKATCQRCCKPVTISLSSEFSSTPDIAKAKSLKIADRLDLIELDKEGNFALLDYLEECLMLEMPYAPAHESGTLGCLVGHDWEFGAKEAEEVDSPFAVLKGMMEKK